VGWGKDLIMCHGLSV